MKEFFRKQMMNPDKIFRPLQIVHNYIPNTKEERETYFDNFKKMGLGGFVINIGGGKEVYPFDEAEWALFKEKIEDAFDHGFRVWIYDELGYPSGAAGTSVVERDPSLRVKAILCRSVKCVSGHAELETRGNEVLAGAFPIIKEDIIECWDIKGEEGAEVIKEESSVSAGTNPMAISEEYHKLQLEDLINSIVTGKTPLVDQNEGRKPVDIILAAYESSRTGKKVFVKK